MKKYIGFVTALMLLLSATFFVTPAAARILASDESVSVLESETIDDDLFVRGSSVTIDGVVNGDLYVAGGNIIINGTINGDVLAAGGVIQISGSVRDDVRIAGGTLTFSNAQIGDSVTAFGGSVTIDSDTSINGGLVFGSGTALIRSAINRGVVGGAGSIQLDSTVGKDTVLGGETISLGPNAKLNGNLQYTSKSEVKVSDTAIVSGEVSKWEPPITSDEMQRQSHDMFQRFAVGFKLWSFGSSLFAGLALLFLFPNFLIQIRDTMRKSLAPSFLWGAVVFTMAPIVAAILMITVLGIPLAIVLLGFYVLFLYLAKVFASFAIGQWAVETLQWERNNKYLSFVIGLLLFSVLTIIPFLGGLAWLAAVLSTLGSLFLWYRTMRAS